jgi:hypothetical protein
VPYTIVATVNTNHLAMSVNLLAFREGNTSLNRTIVAEQGADFGHTKPCSTALLTSGSQTPDKDKSSREFTPKSLLPAARGDLYRLNHFAWLANDTANAPSGVGNPTGPARLFERITLSPDGNQYSGKFTLDAFDTSGNRLAHIVGTVSATRITLHTTVANLL